MKANLTEVLRLLKASKEAEIEAMDQLLKMYGEEKEAAGKLDKKQEKKEKEAAQGDDYDSMTSAQLYKLCSQRGLSGKCKDRKKDTLIALLRSGEEVGKSDKKQEKKEKEAANDSGDDWGEEEKKDYGSMKPRELYDLCVERGIDCEKRKKSEYYIDLLKKDDEASGDDWIEEEEAETVSESDEDWEL